MDYAPSDEKKQALKLVLARMVEDFDLKNGAFAGLDYPSPRDMVTPAWAELAGHAVDDLRDALTDWRVAGNCQLDVSADDERLIEDFKKAVREWRTENEYRDLPTHLTSRDMTWGNVSEMKAYIEEALSSMGLSDVNSDYADGILSAGGIFFDKLGHRFGVRIQVKLKYGGKLDALLMFPYYDLPSALCNFNFLGLLGWIDSKQLNLPEPDRFVWKADRGTTFPELDRFLGILDAVLSYLRPSS
jgi:hypothetical protein